MRGSLFDLAAVDVAQQVLLARLVAPARSTTLPARRPIPLRGLSGAHAQTPCMMLAPILSHDTGPYPSRDRRRPHKTTVSVPKSSKARAAETAF